MNIFFIFILTIYIFLNFIFWIFLKNSQKIARQKKQNNKNFKFKQKFFIGQAAIVLLIFIAFAVYFQVGKFKDLVLSEKIQALIVKQDYKNAEKLLLEELAKKPKDKQTIWFLLTQVAPKIGNYDLGIKAYKKLLQKNGENADFLANLAQLKYLQNGQKTNVQISQLLQKAISLDSKNPLALTLLGMEAFEQKNWQIAQNYWSLAIMQVEDDSLDAQILSLALKNIESKLSSSISVKVSVSDYVAKEIKKLEEKLEEKRKKTQAQTKKDLGIKLLIFTKRKNNSEPLEVIKLEYNDLPKSLSLSYPKEEKDLEVFGLLSFDTETGSYFGRQKINGKKLNLVINQKTK